MAKPCPKSGNSAYEEKYGGKEHEIMRGTNKDV
jgi:hypothetical protein